MLVGLGGAVGYALGGLDWTHTFLGVIFKSQEQILFFFAAVLFSLSVVLHLFSIEEQQYSPQHDRLDQVQCVLSFSFHKIKTYILYCVTKPFFSLFFHQESPDSTNQQQSANGRTGLLAPKLEMIGENETVDSYDLYDPYGDDQSERGDMDMDFLEVELVRSKFTKSSDPNTL